MKQVLTTLIFLTFSVSLFATTFVVNSISDNGIGSLRHNISLAANGDTVRFNPNFINFGSQYVFLDSAIIIDKRIVIMGLYNATDTVFISGGNLTQIFKVNIPYQTNNYKIIFDSVCLINANEGITGYGSAISVNSSSNDTLFIRNSIINNNIGLSGGAIYAQSVSITNSIFKNNHANSSGGVVHSNYLIMAENSTFVNNSANYNGGVFNMGFTGSPKMIISNSYFEGNHSVWNGGVLVCRNVTLFGNEFKNNSSGYGGVTYSSSASFGGFYSIKQCNFENNHADSSGGVMYLRSYFYVSADVDECTFYKNSSGTRGGALYIRPYYSSQCNYVVKINRSTFEENKSKGEGSAINATINYSQYNTDLSTFSIKNTTVYKNESALVGGGAVKLYSPNYQATSTNTIYSNNIGGNFGDTTIINSGGFNVIDDSNFNFVTTDYLNVSDSALNIGPFQNNGGFAKTRMPNNGSVAINKGNTPDTSDAQNRVIIGIRDIGAAENNCQLKDSNFFMQCSLPLIWRNKQITKGGVYRDYYTDTNNGCDSVYEIVIDTVNTLVTLVYPYLRANDSISVLQWLDCNNGYLPFVGDTGYYFTIPSNGNYALAVTKYGCTDTSQCININSLGIEKGELNKIITIAYPNPVIDILKIKTLDSETFKSCKLLSSGGELVLKRDEIGLSSFEIDLSDIPSGNYFLVVEAKNISKTIKIIKL